MKKPKRNKKRKRKRKEKKLELKKTRSWHTLNARMRKAGAMKDRKKETNKKICRKKENGND